MTSKSTITRLKHQLDAIDSEILSLLARRFEAVKALHIHQNISEDDISYTPDVEAKAMRSVYIQNNGVLPPATLSKIWREIISVEEQLHKPFSVAVYTKERPHEMLEMAKDHFGTNGRYVPCLSLSQAIQRVDTKESGVALLPLFEESVESWWTTLSAGAHQDLKIIAKLPFFKPQDNKRTKEGFVIGTAPFNETGSDRSIFAIEMSTQTSIASLKSLLEEQGLCVNQVWPAYNLSRVYLFAVELEGFIPRDDKRVLAFEKAQEKNIQVLRSIGGYAVQETFK